jgi:hypothetical protein
MKDKWKFIIGGLGVMSAYYFMFIRSKSIIDKKSNFTDSEFGKKVKFKLHNDSETNQIVPIFKSTDNIQNEHVEITPSMNEFNRVLEKEPKKIRGIQLLPCGVTNHNDLIQEIHKISDSVKSKLEPTFTSDKKDEEQILFEPNDFKVDGKNYLEYELKPNSMVYLMVHYE